jgi:hypothetical protein
MLQLDETVLPQTIQKTRRWDKVYHQDNFQ